jgi:hypothetical protein
MCLHYLLNVHVALRLYSTPQAQNNINRFVQLVTNSFKMLSIIKKIINNWLCMSE